MPDGFIWRVTYYVCFHEDIWKEVRPGGVMFVQEGWTKMVDRLCFSSSLDVLVSVETA